MKGLLIGVIAIVLILLIIGLSVIGTYNGLITKEQSVDAQWANVETVLQRRFDLVPNLVESVKGGMAQEQKVFGDIAQARTKYAGAATNDEKAAAAGELDGALGRLLVIMENYPQLKSIETVQALMAQLEGTENRISVERNRYNEMAREYNTAIKRFPTNILAGMFGKTEKPYFEAQSGAQEAPKVKF
jgi:LemA protein